MNAISCDGPGCRFKGTDRREFWHLPSIGIDLCLKCVNEFNQKKSQIVNEAEELKNKMLTKLYANYLAGAQEVNIEKSDGEEVI